MLPNLFPGYNENNNIDEVREMSKIIFNEIQMKQLENRFDLKIIDPNKPSQYLKRWRNVYEQLAGEKV